jgi:DNA adenine methylase
MWRYIEMVTPILKWAGGKRQLLDELQQRFPEGYDISENTYHEPFFGSGALFFELEPSRATINDLNTRLHNFYIQVRNRPNSLIETCRQFEDPTSDPDPEKPHSDEENYYYQHRKLFNRRPRGEDVDPLEEAALLLYLNRTCFNGLYRENKTGEFNVPIGDYNDPDWVRAEEIRNASEVLTELPEKNIHNENFDYVLEVADAGDLVYFDPPYEPMSPTAEFAEYSAGGFDREDQESLLEVAQELDENGVHVILSNSGVMYDFYDEACFYVETEGATRAINSDGDNRGTVDEIIATNVDPEQQQDHGPRTLSDF